MKTIRAVLKPDKDKPIRAFHPWVFSGAIDLVDDDFETGDLVKVYSKEEEFLGIGYLNPRSQIAIRMLTFQDEAIDRQFFVKRMTAAKRLREEFFPPGTDAFRLIHSEGDFLPGLIVDRYADFLVTQFSTAGTDVLKPVVVEALKAVFPLSPQGRGEGEGLLFETKGIYERDDSESRRLEGLDVGKQEGSGVGVRRAVPLQVLDGEEPPDFVEIKEYGHRFVVDMKHGQKTGFFLDQRENRNMVADLAKGRRVLDCFAYSGGFSVYAAEGGAKSVTSVESQQRAFNTLKTNLELNGLTGGPYVQALEDVFEFLRKDQALYDLVILDPPAFCKHKNQVNQAARGYKDINLYAIKRLAAGGILFTSSCSSFIDPDLFQKIVFAAAKDASRNVQIIKKTSHAFDHPINIYHPEGEYLKGLLLKVQ